MKRITRSNIYLAIMAMILTAALAVPAVAQKQQQPEGKSPGPRYVVTDLGTFGGGFSNSFGLNERDQVGGGSTLPDGTMQAFLWSARSGMQPLGTLHGGSNSSASGPNANDLVALI